MVGAVASAFVAAPRVREPDRRGKGASRLRGAGGGSVLPRSTTNSTPTGWPSSDSSVRLTSPLHFELSQGIVSGFSTPTMHFEPSYETRLVSRNQVRKAFGPI